MCCNETTCTPKQSVWMYVTVHTHGEKTQLSYSSYSTKHKPNNSQLSQSSIPMFCDFLNASRHFTKDKTNPTTVICKDNHLLAFRNKLSSSQRSRKTGRDRQADAGEERQQNRQRVKDRHSTTELLSLQLLSQLSHHFHNLLPHMQIHRWIQETRSGGRVMHFMSDPISSHVTAVSRGWWLE